MYDNLSIIHQNVFIFNSSILENITMFKDFSEKEITNAMQKSGLQEVVFTKGDDYHCGENGNNLSGGEKQRISIARSLLRKSSVLLMDEATSSLDIETAKHVEEAVLGIENLTRVIVTHRLDKNLLNKFDQIICMKNGRIAEIGSFDELKEKESYFCKLYESYDESLLKQVDGKTC